MNSKERAKFQPSVIDVRQRFEKIKKNPLSFIKKNGRFLLKPEIKKVDLRIKKLEGVVGLKKP